MRDPLITSRIMRRIGSRDTKAEVLLRKKVFALGLRYRKNDPRLLGKPDLAFWGARVCVFVDGDFWHGREWKVRGHTSLETAFKTNSEFWVSKISSNVRRDREQTRQLRSDGWLVLRFWESCVLKSPEQVARRVQTVLAKRRQNG